MILKKISRRQKGMQNDHPGDRVADLHLFLEGTRELGIYRI